MSYWMISDRELPAEGPQTPANFGDQRGGLTFWTADSGPVTDPAKWTGVSRALFQLRLIAAAGRFPDLNSIHQNNDDQRHVAFFIHGFNSTWAVEAQRYQTLCDALFAGPDSLGECIMYDWPSLGNVFGYLPDREHARDCASDLADVLSSLYEYIARSKWRRAKMRLTRARRKFR